MNTERVDELCHEARTIYAGAVELQQSLLDHRAQLSASPEIRATESVKAEFFFDQADTKLAELQQLLQSMYPLAIVFLDKRTRDAWIRRNETLLVDTGESHEAPSDDQQLDARSNLEQYTTIRDGIVEDNEELVGAVLMQLRSMRDEGTTLLQDIESALDRYRHYTTVREPIAV